MKERVDRLKSGDRDTWSKELKKGKKYSQIVEEIVKKIKDDKVDSSKK